ncbi:MAG: hypothetical protein Tsb0014_30830 [Pleurocapsa sp.]
MVFRLNKKAYNILLIGIEEAIAKDSLGGEVAGKIALKRLNQLRAQKGKLANQQELELLFSDIFPSFNPKILKKAARANRKPSSLWLIPKIGLFLATVSGFIWLLNLPYPMIRRPVARTAPIVLLPSYISMDRNYRQAIAKVEQADQLVNKATSAADLELGATKVQQAQKHLDALPVWFLGYEPRIFMTWFRFSWLFTLDEFKAARASVGRMEAKIFQEKNAMTELEKSEQKIQQAKQSYQQASDSVSKQDAIALWQDGMDELTQIPSSTLAGEKAKVKLNAYRRDFQKISGLVAGNHRTNIVITVAQQFADRADQTCGNLPNRVNRWEQCASLWQEAINKLQNVSLDDPGYLEAQTLLAIYQTNLGEVEIKRQDESQSVQALNNAKSQIIQFPKQIDSRNKEFAAKQIQTIINQLEQVQPDTTAYNEARELMNFAEKKFQQIQNL